jgi:hypothetical protein
MARKTTPRVTITNPKASRLPSQRGTFASNPPTPDPVTPLPRKRPGEIVTDSDRVEVTGSTKTQRPAKGNF